MQERRYPSIFMSTDCEDDDKDASGVESGVQFVPDARHGKRGQGVYRVVFGQITSGGFVRHSMG